MNRRRLLMPILLVAALVFLLQPAPRAASTQAQAVPPPRRPRRRRRPRSAAPRPMELADILAWKSVSRPCSRPTAAGSPTACRRSTATARSSSARRRATRMHRFAVGDIRGDARVARHFRRLEVGGLQRRPDQEGSGAAQEAAQAAAEQGRHPQPGRRDRDEDRQDPAVRLLGRAGGVDRAEEVRRGRGRGGGGGALGRAAARRRGAAGSAPTIGRRARTSSSTSWRPASELNVGNVNEFAFDKSGKFLALTIDAADKLGNGVVLRDMETGVVSPLDSGKASYERLAWTEKGDAPRRAEGHRRQALQGQGLRGRRRSRSSASRSRRRSSTTRPPTRRSPRACRSARTGRRRGPRTCRRSRSASAR